MLFTISFILHTSKIEDLNVLSILRQSGSGATFACRPLTIEMIKMKAELNESIQITSSAALDSRTYGMTPSFAKASPPRKAVPLSHNVVKTSNFISTAIVIGRIPGIRQTIESASERTTC